MSILLLNPVGCRFHHFREFSLDRVGFSDVMARQARLQAQKYSNCIYIPVKMLQQEEETGLITIENSSLVLTEAVLLFLRRKKGI